MQYLPEKFMYKYLLQENLMFKNTLNYLLEERKENAQFHYLYEMVSLLDTNNKLQFGFGCKTSIKTYRSYESLRS